MYKTGRIKYDSLKFVMVNMLEELAKAMLCEMDRHAILLVFKFHNKKNYDVWHSLLKSY